MKTNILYISPDFNYSCGVSKHVYISLKQLSKKNVYKLFFITNKGDSLDRLQNIPDLSFSLMNFEKDHKNIVKLFIDLYKLLSFCKKNRIDIIHTHHRYLELVSVLVSKFTAIRTVSTVHSFVKSLKKISFRSQKIITVSRAVQLHIENNYPHTIGRITTLYNCLENSFYNTIKINPYEFKSSLGFNDSDKILLFTGRIAKIKGTDTLIEAFNKLPSHFCAKLLLIGSVSDIHLQSLIKNNVTNIKIIEPQKDLKPFYQIADVIVLPSIEDPFPYVMLEAGAMKKPFIGGATGGIQEFIDDNINGFLIKPGNIEELYQKIIFVLENYSTALQAGEKLFSKVQQYCNCEKYFINLIKIYDGLIQK